MIIDFSRKFTSDEFNYYCDVIERWFSREEKVNRYADYEEYYNPDTECFVTEEEIFWLKQLKTQTDKVIAVYKKKYKYITSVHETQATFQVRIFWLNSRDISYALVYHPHPESSTAVLMLRDQVIFQEMDIVFKSSSFWISESDVDFLVKNRKYNIIELYHSVPDLIKWVKMCCQGVVRFVRINMYTMVLFEFEKDLLLYKLTFYGG